MKRFFILFFSLVILTTTMCNKDNSVNNNTLYQTVQILLKLKGPAYQGTYYPDYLQITTDYAIWIEDAERTFVKTLQITPVAVTVDSAHGSHIEHLPVWSEASGLSYEDLELETDDGIAPSFDGITSASPFFAVGEVEQTLTVNWDLTDANGQDIESGIYYCCAEAANIIKDGDFDVGTETNFEINSETISVQLNLTNGTSNADPATDNLTGIEATFVE
ncbi:DUF2271 domain-containing protein [bacterium]